MIRRSARLNLRPVLPTDLPFMIDLFGRSELVAHRPHPIPDPPEVSRANLDRALAHWRLHGFGRWLVEHERVAVGLAGVTHKDGFAGLNLSYHLHPDAWGRGYALEAAGEVVETAFRDLGAARVIGLVRSANPPSERVLERLGFAREGEVMLGGAPTNLWARYC